jgi:hypothetical protein
VISVVPHVLPVVALAAVLKVESTLIVVEAIRRLDALWRVHTQDGPLLWAETGES